MVAHAFAGFLNIVAQTDIDLPVARFRSRMSSALPRPHPSPTVTAEAEAELREAIGWDRSGLAFQIIPQATPV
jgi:hypothetical protein